jgi:alpha-L-fucosidase
LVAASRQQVRHPETKDIHRTLKPRLASLFVMTPATVFTAVMICVRGVCILLLAGSLFATPAAGAESEFSTNGFDFNIASGPFQPDMKSLAENYRSPEWFHDLKFGIYMHWGLNSVSGFNGHYARWMYRQDQPEAAYNHHVATFGHPTKFGYKDFIPLWQADKFDADALAKLYKNVGARFVGVMAVHHDNFDLWDSTYQPWNSVEMGPKLNIVGAWQAAARKHGLRFFVTTHLSNQYHEHLFYQGIADISGTLKDVPYDTVDPRYQGLYGKRTADGKRMINPDFARLWFLRMKDLVDKYEPDLLYLDSQDLPDGFNLAAHFYNQSARKHDGHQENIITIKRPARGFSIDIEAAGADNIRPEPFLLDTSLNPGWFYLGKKIHNAPTADAGGGATGDNGVDPDRLRLTGGRVIHLLADCVSKNGNLMLNVGLRPDGSLPETFQRELLEIGAWLKINGEAIYGTRPFRVYGEGLFQKPKSKNHFNDSEYKFVAQDIRFTQSKDGKTVYAIALGMPTEPLIIKALGVEKIHDITLLGSDAKIDWKQDAGALVIQPVAKWPSEHAATFKVQL